MKKKLLSIITCVMITAVMITTSINANALSAGATYTAYEIISMIFAVVGGTTIERQQGIIGGSHFDADAIYQSMNAQSPGIGSLLSSYVNRAQYLNPGSDLLISENDYQEFLEYFKNYNLEIHMGGDLGESDISQIRQFLSEKVGYQVPPMWVRDGYNTFVVVTGYDQGGVFGSELGLSIVWCKDFEARNTDFGLYLYSSDTYSFCNVNGWYENPGGVGLKIRNDYTVYYAKATVSIKTDSLINGKIKNETYDTISKSRTWDATQGKLKGPVTLTMPATSTLSDVLERENVKDITDAINVYPTDTADDSLIYYPTQSVPDFIVPTITVNPSITFPGVDGGISDYTIELRNFFPFCIPWDIYDMLSAFVTTPETPEFTFQFPTGVINHQIQWTECKFDLHAWDGVAQGLRTLELIAFAVGLALMTRNIFLRG